MNIGHDAEFVVLNKEGQAVPAHEFFPSKRAPIYTGYMTNPNYHRDQIFRDGTSLEVNTPSGILCIAHMLTSTAGSLRAAQKLLPTGYTIEAKSAYRIEKDLAEAPPDVLESGCSPVRNAYDGWEEKAVFMDPKSKVRFAGGHIHLSGTEMDRPLRDEKKRPRFCSFVTKYLDLFLAVPMLYTQIENGDGAERRKVYGKAGEYRFQTYTSPATFKPVGLEYRVLGPEWLKDVGTAAITIMLARTAVRRAVVKYEAGKLIPKSSLVQEAREAINSGDTKQIFQSPTYQKRLSVVLKDQFPAITVRHFEFMRENHEKLFQRLTIHAFTGDFHDNFPQCLTRWGYRP